MKTLRWPLLMFALLQSAPALAADQIRVADPRDLKRFDALVKQAIVDPGLRNLPRPSEAPKPAVTTAAAPMPSPAIAVAASNPSAAGAKSESPRAAVIQQFLKAVASQDLSGVQATLVRQMREKLGSAEAIDNLRAYLARHENLAVSSEKLIYSAGEGGLESYQAEVSSKDRVGGVAGVLDVSVLCGGGRCRIKSYSVRD